MKKFLRYTCFMLAIIFIMLGITVKSFNVALGGLCFLYANNIIYCIENIKKRIFLLMFHITIYVFLLSRPTIAVFRKELWWQDGGSEHVLVSLIMIGLSLLALYIGALLGERRQKISDMHKNNIKLIVSKKNKEEFIKNLQIFSQIIFYIAILFYMGLEFEKLWFMRGKNYLSFYTSFESHAPQIVVIIASFMRYSLCVFLGTMPSKKKSVIPLGLYFLSAVPSLLIGLRNPIMLNAIFVFLYYFARDVLVDKEKWLGKYEKLLIGISTPFVLVFMAAYSIIRSGINSVGEGFLKLFVDFFYGQGVTFKVLAIGHASIPKLPNEAFRNYTFGGFIDYFTHGSIAQNFFGAQALDNGNTLNNALNSNSFAHNMSYVSKGKEYLEGHGWGSSYLLETYADYGYIGIIIFSILIAILLIYGMRILKKNSLCATIFLLILTQVFFAPRAEATGFLSFIITMQFWVTMIICYLGAGLFTKRYTVQRRKQEEKHV